MCGALTGSLFFADQDRIKLGRDFRSILVVSGRKHEFPVEIDPRKRSQFYPRNFLNSQRFVRIGVRSAELVSFALNPQKNMFGLGSPSKSSLPIEVRRLALEDFAEIGSARDVAPPHVTLKIQPVVILIVAEQRDTCVVAHSLDLQRLFHDQLEVICRQLSIQQQVILQVL